MKIREATLEDIPTLIELGVAMTAESPVLSKKIPNYKKQYQNVTAMIESPYCCVFVPDDVTGMLLGHLQDDPWYDGFSCCEDILFVKREFRNSSRAVRLVKAFLDWGKSHNAPMAYVGNNIDSNVEVTEALYTGLGAVKRNGLNMEFDLTEAAHV